MKQLFWRFVFVFCFLLVNILVNAQTVVDTSGSFTQRLHRLRQIHLIMDSTKLDRWNSFLADYPPISYSMNDFLNAPDTDRQLYLTVIEEVGTQLFMRHRWDELERVFIICPLLELDNFYTHFIIYDLRLDEPIVDDATTLRLARLLMSITCWRMPDSVAFVREHKDMFAFHAELLEKHGQYSEAFRFANVVSPYEGTENVAFNEAYVNLYEHLGRHVQAVEFVRKAISSGAYSPAMIEVLRADYKAGKGSDDGFLDYVGSLKSAERVEKEHAGIRKEMVDIPAAAFDLRDTAGNLVSLKKLGGKIVVLDFWATWCYYCKLAMPGMQMAVNKYKQDDNVRFYFIATSEVLPDYRELIAKFLKEKGYDFHVLYDATSTKTGKMDACYNSYARLVHSEGIPLKVVIDQKGHIRWASMGGSDNAIGIADEVSYVVGLLKGEERGGAAASAGLHGQDTSRKVAAADLVQKGLFTIHQKDNHYLFEIPDSLLGRDILSVSRIDKGAAGSKGYALGYAGDQINYNVIRFEPGRAGKLWMRASYYAEKGSDSSANGLLHAFDNSNVAPIIVAFDIKAKQPGSTTIDMTEYINGDNDILFFDPGTKRTLGLGGFAADRSYVMNVKAFPENIELKTVKTYSKSGDALLSSGGGGAGGEAATFQLNTSIVLLPRVPMKPRYADKRIGYFTTGYTDFDANPQGVKKIDMILRWRLEPKDGDMAKYRRGELVEPRQPIVYYIDPATPAKWKPYLKQGVADWQAAFEQAGFKHAIIALDAPAEDTTWSIDDARHNVIVYKPSDVQNATSPQIHDPRSGEILETHINWYHNILSLLHNWYLIQAGGVDPRARHMVFDDSLMGQLIRFVAAHEIGHTLGLEHNFGSSSTVPVEKLRDAAFLRTNGHTPSIMDYARFNYVAQPEDHIPEELLFPRVGDYDKWAIEWGYKYLPQFATPAEESAWLSTRTSRRLDANPRLWYGPESDLRDPRTQSEDLGDNAMKAGKYGILNLQRIALGLPEWTRQPGGSYDDLHNMYSEVTAQFARYIGHVLRNVGGERNTYKTTDQPGAVHEIVPRELQREAVEFLQHQLFATPDWFVRYKNNDDRLAESMSVNTVFVLASLQQSALSRLVSHDVMDRLLYWNTLPGAKPYTVDELLDDLTRGIFAEADAHRPVDLYRRNLQKMYVDRLIAIVQPVTGGSPATTDFYDSMRDGDVATLVEDHCRRVLSILTKAIPFAANRMTRLHWAELAERLSVALKPGVAARAHK
ncbi:MAG TPA: zinc-dependent metalloprotease [Puia sp.]